MFYILYGPDTYRSRRNAREIAEKFRAKNSDYHFFRINPEDFNEGSFYDILRTRTMFGGKSLVILDGVLADQKISQFILRNADELRDSENIFVFLDSEVDTDVLAEMKKRAEKFQEFYLLKDARLRGWIKNEAERLGFDIDAATVAAIAEDCGSDLWSAARQLEIMYLSGEDRKVSIGEFREKDAGLMFDLADAFASKRKKTALALFEKYRSLGVPAEEALWRLHWQIKTLLAVKKLGKNSSAQIAKLTGFKPYSVQKCLAAAPRFSERELERLWQKVLEILHDSKMGFADAEYNVIDLLLKIKV